MLCSVLLVGMSSFREEGEPVSLCLLIEVGGEPVSLCPFFVSLIFLTGAMLYLAELEGVLGSLIFLGKFLESACYSEVLLGFFLNLALGGGLSQLGNWVPNPYLLGITSQVCHYSDPFYID